MLERREAWPGTALAPPSLSLNGLIRAAQGISDAFVDGVGLPVDAVGVDLEQDGDAMPGAVGDFSGGYPGVEPQRDGGVAQVVGAAGQRGGCWAGVNTTVRAACQTAL